MTRYEDLTFTNNFMFCRILESDPELCKEIVETILDVRINRIENVSSEKSVEVTEDGHGVRFDVYFEDDDKTAYEIEMQVDYRADLPKRSRYYQGMIDLNQFNRGDEYDKLKRTYIIIICDFDLFGQGRYKYTFENRCLEDKSLLLGDEATKVFVNIKGRADGASERMKEFLTYLNAGSPEGPLSEKIHDRVRSARKNKDWRMKFMTFEWYLNEKYREGRAEGEAKGRAEGEAKGRADVMKALLEKGLIDRDKLEEIKELLD